jgi:hypothetical protein
MTTTFLAFALLAAVAMQLCNEAIVEIGFFGGKKQLQGRNNCSGN